MAEHAKAFLDAYDALNQSMYAIVEQHGMRFRMPLVERLHLSSPAITCVAFAAEIAIKALIVSSANGDVSACPKNQHSLHVIFKQVSNDLRVSIADELKMPLSQVDANLEKNANAFVKWRYAYESSAWADEEFLGDFVRAALVALEGCKNAR